MVLYEFEMVFKKYLIIRLFESFSWDFHSILHYSWKKRCHSHQEVGLLLVGPRKAPPRAFPLFKAHRTNCQQALRKLNILRKLSGTSWGSRPQTLKSTFCTVIRSVLEYATPIWTPASISVKRKLHSVQHRAAKIIIGAVSSTNIEKAEQECGLPPLESRRNLATIKFTNKLRSYCLDHISRKVFDKWKYSTRLKRSSTLQLDSEIRKELNLEHSSLEFLQEPLIPKNPPKNTCFELELLRPCSKKKDAETLRQKGLETIEILSQDNFAKSPTPMVPRADPSAMEVPESSSSSQMDIIKHSQTSTEFDCPRIITSTIARLRTEHLKGMKIHPDKTRSYVQCKHCPDLQLMPNHILECPTVATSLLKMGMVPLRDSLRELLYSPDTPRIAEAVIKTFDGI
ncbi:RNase H domain-containing protein [Trichonephila clavipes]|nr:RNase H domain-containing protein [Trichonephila clavipes]